MQGIIFDLDGTLIDSLPAIAASLNAALDCHHCHTHETTAIREFIGDGAKMLVQRALGNDNSHYSNSLLLEKVLCSFREHYAENWQNGTRVYPKIHEIIERCQQRGFKLAVLSNKPHEYTQVIVAKLFPTHPFEIVWGERKEFQKKPHPQALDLIIKHWNFAAGQCCMIGDSSIDVLTAHRANAMSVAVGWGYHDFSALMEVKPHFIVHDAEELLNWLEKDEEV